MTDENQLNDSMVRTQIDGPDGKTWVLVDKESRLGDLRAVLDAKLRAYRERTGQRDVDAFDLLNDHDEHPEAIKLYMWIRDREIELDELPDEGKEDRIRDQQESVFKQRIDRNRTILERVEKEEELGARITIYDKGKFITSLTKDALLEELHTIQKYHSHLLSDEQSKKVREWSEGKTPTKIDEYQIRLKHLDGSGFFVLRPNDHPDLLRAAVRDRQNELGKAKSELVDLWIEKSHNDDFEHRIRIFPSGLDKFENTVEVDLNEFKIDFVEYLYKQMSCTAVALLPEHKKRLDQYYNRLLEQSKDHKQPQSIQFPVSISGETVYVDRNTDRGVLEAATEMYRKNVSEDNRRWLWHWTRNTPTDDRSEHLIRVYQRDNPNYFRNFNRFEDIERIERIINNYSEHLYVTSADRKKATGWLESMEQMDKSATKTIKMMHSTQLECYVTEHLAKSDPKKVSELLEDASWTTTAKNRTQILKWLGREDKSPEEQIFVAGKAFSRENSLETLKGLASSLVDGGFEELSPEAAKKLLTWIHTKEKLGDDYYLQERYKKSIGADRLPRKSKLDQALKEILNEVGKTKTTPGKDKDDDILPSRN